MSLTAQIGSSDSAFKLSQKLVSSLAEKFGFKFEDGWAVVSSRSVENVQKRLKREKKRSNPAAQVKHPRTAFSFFTQKQRPVEAAAHPNATFGQLSGFVAAAWKSLAAADLQKYKDMEASDKARYQTERTAALAAVPVVDAAAATVTAPVAAAPAADAKPKKAAKAKAAAAAPAEATSAAATPAAAPAKAAKAPKAKAATPAAAAVVAVAAAPVAAAVAVAAPAKAAKGKKADATPTPAPAAAPVVAAPAKAAAPKSAGKKAVKA
jgi:hypothetical protein